MYDKKQLKGGRACFTALQFHSEGEMIKGQGHGNLWQGMFPTQYTRSRELRVKVGLPNNLKALSQYLINSSYLKTLCQ